MLLLQYYIDGLDPEKYILQKLRGICYYSDSEDAEDANDIGDTDEDDVGASDEAASTSGAAGAGGPADEDDGWGDFDTFGNPNTNDLGPQSFSVGDVDFESRGIDPSGKSDPFGFERAELEREARSKAEAAAQQDIETAAALGIEDIGAFGAVDTLGTISDFSFGEFDVVDLVQGVISGFAGLIGGPIAGIAVNAAIDFGRGKSFSQALSNAAIGSLGPGATTVASAIGIDDVLSSGIRGAAPGLDTATQGFTSGVESAFSPATNALGDFSNSLASQLDSLTEGLGNLGDFGTVSSPGVEEGGELPIFDRTDLLNNLLTQVRGNTPNPGVDPKDFDDIIKGGILGYNLGLPQDIEANSIEDALSQTGVDPNTLGQDILASESDRRGREFANANDQFFQDLGGSLTAEPQLIEDILSSLRAPTSQRISDLQARGNLNPLGGRTAEQFVNEQAEQAREALGQGQEALTGRFVGDLRGIEAQADEAARGFQLGQPDFDFTPFETQANELLAERQSTLRPDLEAELGGRNFFNPLSAARAGTSVQGLVRGGPVGSGGTSGIADPSVVGSLTGAGRDEFTNRRRSRGNVGSGAF